eukprot:Clim_evm19s22 gene=Clim_evmTU19s22
MPDRDALRRSAIKQNTPSVWLTYLENEQTLYDVGTGLSKDKLLMLYKRATDSIPKESYSNNAEYVKIWLQFCGLSEDEDARLLFRYLKGERICERRAVFWIMYADFEARGGNNDKAVEILQKGSEFIEKKAADPVLEAEIMSIAMDRFAEGKRLFEPSMLDRLVQREPRDASIADSDVTVEAPVGQQQGQRSTTRPAPQQNRHRTPAHPPTTRSTADTMHSQHRNTATMNGPSRTLGHTTSSTSTASTSSNSQASLSSSSRSSGFHTQATAIPAMPDGHHAPPVIMPHGHQQPQYHHQQGHGSSGDEGRPVPMQQMQAPVPQQPQQQQQQQQHVHYHPQSATIPPQQTAPMIGHPGQVPNGYPAAAHQQHVMSSAQKPRKIIGQDALLNPESDIVVGGNRYVKLQLIGKGGSSKVYKVMNRDDLKLYALKQVKLAGESQSTQNGYKEEVKLLKGLQKSAHVIKVVAYEEHEDIETMLIVMELGECDFSKLLKRLRSPGSNCIEINYLRLYWEQMLDAVNTIHDENIVHSDLKPANFLCVEGSLKLIDFGIAKQIQTDKTSTVRDAAVGTLNYMSPEAIQDSSTVVNLDENGKRQHILKIGRPSDVWSLGCILYSMVYGKTPFQQFSMVQKLQAITDPKHEIPLPPVPEPLRSADTEIRDVLRTCLKRKPKERATVAELLNHRFLKPTVLDQVAEKNSDLITVDEAQMGLIVQQIAKHNFRNMEEVKSVTREIMDQLQRKVKEPELSFRRAAALAASATVVSTLERGSPAPAPRRAEPVEVPKAAADSPPTMITSATSAVPEKENNIPHVVPATKSKGITSIGMMRSRRVPLSTINSTSS